MKTRMAQTAAHPERFVTGRPQPADLPTAVWVNPPAKNATLITSSLVSQCH